MFCSVCIDMKCYSWKCSLNLLNNAKYEHLSSHVTCYMQEIVSLVSKRGFQNSTLFPFCDTTLM